MDNKQKKIESLLSASVSLREAGENSQALNLLDEIIQLDQSFVDAYVLKGTILLEEREIESAEVSLRQALEIKKDYPLALQAFGNFLVSQERYEEAIPYLQQHLEEFPDDWFSLILIIKAYEALPDRMNSILAVLKVGWEYSTNPDVGILFANKLAFHHEKEEAYSIYNRVLEITRNPEALTEYGFSCWLFDDYEKAIDLLGEAVKSDSSNPKAWHFLADCYFQTNEASKALEAIEHAISEDPNNYRNWRLKTDILIRKKEYKKALFSADKGIELLKENHGALNNLKDSFRNPFFQKMHILFRLGRVEEALNSASIARNLIPENPYSYILAAQELGELNRAEEALELLDSVEDLEVVKYFHWLRFKLFHQLERGQEALDDIREWIQDDLQSNIEKLAFFGIDFYEKGDRKTALIIYQQLLSFDPENLRLKNNIGYILIGKEKYEQAELLINEVIKEGNQAIDSEISKCNLAYLYAIQGRPDKVFPLVKEVENSELATEVALLRVPIWFQGKVQLDPAQFPGRNLSLVSAALGCGLACSLAIGDMDQANGFMKKLISGEYNDPMPLVCLGSIEAAYGNDEKAIDAWKHAIEITKNPEEKTILENWVVDLQ